MFILSFLMCKVRNILKNCSLDQIRWNCCKIPCIVELQNELTAPCINFVRVLFWPLLGLFLCFGHNPSKYVEPNPCQKFQVILGFFKTAKMSFDINESHNFQFRTFCCILTQYLECNLMIFKKLPKNSNSIYAKLTL